MTITITWWMIPALITIIGVVYALFIHKDNGGWLSGLENILLLLPVLTVSLLAWVIAAFIKIWSMSC